MTIKKKELPNWKELPEAGLIVKPGSAQDFETGDWRSMCPKWDKDKCIHCLNCWIYCPDTAVIVKDGKVVGIDMEHCKGCGICEKVCPAKVQAITMEPEKG